MQTFAEIFADAVRQSSPRVLPAGECQNQRGQRCRLCHAVTLTYDRELDLKERALRTFWKQHFSKVPLAPLVSSPLGRGYRTVSKRKLFTDRNGVVLGLIDPAERSSAGAFSVARCAIEPDHHEAVYALVSENINKMHMHPLASVLTYVIVKGSSEQCVVIFNVKKISGVVVKSVNTLSRLLTSRVTAVAGVYVYEGSGSDSYYLGSGGGRAGTLRKVFGISNLSLKVRGRTLRYSPLAFSQVNQSILGTLIDRVGQAVSPQKGDSLIDLYSGFGMFGLCLAGEVRSVVGVEQSPPSIVSARDNATHLRASNARFVQREISVTSLGSILANIRGDFRVILDPPRGGTSEGVIELIAAKRPARVAHLFCDMEVMPGEITRWLKAGFTIDHATPFDMFPGTSAMELLIAFKPV